MYVLVAYLMRGEITAKREFGNLELIADIHPKVVDENAT